MDNKNIYNLELHEYIDVAPLGRVFATRVAGGWIYTTQIGNYRNETFVPYNDEFNNNYITITKEEYDSLKRDSDDLQKVSFSM